MTDGDDAQAANKADQTRTYLGALVIVIALVIVVIVFLAGVGKLTASADVATALGSVTTVIGTLVGFFFGNSAGSAGKEKAETARRDTERKLNRVVADREDLARVRAILEG
jgi:amino acid transporter